MVSETCPNAFAYSRLRKSTHMRSSLVFLRTKRMGAPYGDTLGLIQPFANISSTCCCTTSNSFAERWYYLCLGGVHVFVHQIDCVIQRSMWGKSRCLKNILKLVAKSSKTRSLSFPPPQTHSTHRMVEQELPSRLHWARFSKLQASFEQKPIWRELTKEPCSQEQ